MKKSKLIKWVDERRYMSNGKQILLYFQLDTCISMQGEIYNI